MTYGDYPREALIHCLAGALEANDDELLLVAEKIPERIMKRMLEGSMRFNSLPRSTTSQWMCLYEQQREQSV